MDKVDNCEDFGNESTEKDSSTEIKSNSRKEPFASVVDRYFTRLFKVNLPHGKVDFNDFKTNRNDVRILWHSNRICLVTLAPSHPVLLTGKSVKDISYKVTLKCNRAKNNVSGKRKRGAQWLNPESPLCIITLENGEVFTVHSGIRGNLLEVNENLIKNPGLLVEKPESDGYIAVIMIKLQEKDSLARELMSESQYQDYLKCIDHS